MVHSTRRSSERGGMLIFLMIGVAVSMIALSAAMQSWSTTWRRDSEDELIFRGNQYVDAILAYRKEHGGQFPTNLEDLFEQGPRRVRYIRKLFPEPIAKDGKWGLLYLMPGGQGVFDPGAAERQAAGGGSLPSGRAFTSGGIPGQPGGLGQVIPGMTPLNTDPTGRGVPGTSGLIPGALPGLGNPAGGIGGTPSFTPPGSGLDRGWGDGDEDQDDGSISERPLGWPIVGVVSRASGSRAENTYKIYKGHSQVNEWQFHVFDRGIQLEQAPTGANPQRPQSPGFIGPSFGGKGKVRGINRLNQPRTAPRPGVRGLFPGTGGKDDPDQ